MERKGQVTLFVIIAILIVVAGILVYNFALSPEGGRSVSSSEVETYVSDCIDKSFLEVLTYVGDGGGYYIPPVLKSPQGFSYYYDGESFILPTRERIEEEIENGVNNEVLFCLDGFREFSNLEIEARQIESSVKIEDTRVLLSVEYPISITDGEERVLLKDFSGYQVSVRLGEIHNGILELFNDNYYLNGGTCLDCLLDFMEESEVEVEIYSEGEDDIFIFRDYLEEGEGAYRFMFANKK